MALAAGVSGEKSRSNPLNLGRFLKLETHSEARLHENLKFFPSLLDAEGEEWEILLCERGKFPAGEEASNWKREKNTRTRFVVLDWMGACSL